MKKTDLTGVFHSVRGERVKTIYQTLEMPQGRFAEMIGITQSAVSEMVNGKRKVTETTAQAIVQAFPKYRFEWIMGYDDFPTNDDMKAAQQYNDYLNNEFTKSHVETTKGNFARIIMCNSVHVGDIILVHEPRNMAQLYREGYIDKEDFSHFKKSGIVSEDAHYWLDELNEYVFAIGGKHYHISPTDFFKMADDVEQYAMFRIKEYIRTRYGGITDGGKQ